MAATQSDRVEQIVTQLINEFSQPLDDNAAKESIAAVCSPDIIWSDHAFHIQRSGHEAVLGLRKAFNHCNQPLETRVKHMQRTASGMVVQAIWVGCCKNDIIRPNGDVAVKANGRDFVCHVCFVMEVDPSAGITRIDEYYNRPWWDGVSEDEYQKIRGASLKT